MERSPANEETVLETDLVRYFNSRETMARFFLPIVVLLMAAVVVLCEKDLNAAETGWGGIGYGGWGGRGWGGHGIGGWGGYGGWGGRGWGGYGGWGGHGAWGGRWGGWH